MFRLTDDEIVEIVKGFEYKGAPPQWWRHEYPKFCTTQMKKLLLGISKETKKLDGTTYLVPDYSKFKEALEEMNDVQTY